MKKNPTPRELMELAIEAMHKSIDEPRKDGKPSPKVGAVLVKPDGAIETAYRGELRYGDHAEFTLLERKNRSNLVEGSTLYATLEPCAPGARNHPKLGCAERIVNARIRKVYVGIEDDDPKVARKGIQHLIDHGIEVEMFPRDLQEQIRDANKDFIEGARERAKQETPKPNPLSSLERRGGVNVAQSDFENKAKVKYAEALEKKFKTHIDLEARFLEQGILIKEGGEKIPSGFGLLLFGREPRNSFHQAGLLATVNYPNGKTETKNFAGPMVLIPGELQEWLDKVLALTGDRNRMERVDSTDIPFEVIREAVINALIHRDYSIEEAKCQLLIDENSITIKSPGKPLAPITLEQMQDFSAPMLSRNPLLHYVFSEMNLAEERGLGLSTLKSVPQKYGLPRPAYSFEDPYLVLTIYRKQAISENQLSALKADELEGWNWVRSQDSFTSSQYTKATGVSSRTALRHLAHFRELGKIERRGSGPATRYFVIHK